MDTQVVARSVCPNTLETLNEKATAVRPTGLHLSPYAIVWLTSAALALMTAEECRSVTHLSSLLYGITLWGWWGIVASILWKTGERKPFLSGFSAGFVLLHTAAAALLGWLHLVALWSLGFTGMGWYAGLSRHLAWRSLLNINRFGIEILVFGFVLGLVGVIQYQSYSQHEAMRVLELQKQLSTAQLQALQMQLEPHFLLNTLNAITTLVELGRQSEAVEMLSHLNGILKKTLKRAAPEKVPLSQELEMIEDYLAIEQVRFADRLRIEIKVDPGALDSLVPCFLLQPIVENAIRHGIAHCEDYGVIVASACRDGERLRIEVCNTGSTAPHTAPGNGIGLKNTRERLTHFYRDTFEMKTMPFNAGGFTVSIAIPYERR
jgi:signal transduction histidine kinase